MLDREFIFTWRPVVNAVFVGIPWLLGVWMIVDVIRGLLKKGGEQ